MADLAGDIEEYVNYLTLLKKCEQKTNLIFINRHSQSSPVTCVTVTCHSHLSLSYALTVTFNRHLGYVLTVTCFNCHSNRHLEYVLTVTICGLLYICLLSKSGYMLTC